MPIKDLAPYLLIMQYPAKERINADELAQKLGKSKMAIGSMISHAALDGTVYLELRKAGYAESQIPAWITRESHRKKRQKPAEGVQKGAEGVQKGAEGVQRGAEASGTQRKLTEIIVEGTAIGTGSQSSGAGASAGSGLSLPAPASSGQPSASSGLSPPVSTGGSDSAQKTPSGGNVADSDSTEIVKVELPKVLPSASEF